MSRSSFIVIRRLMISMTLSVLPNSEISVEEWDVKHAKEKWGS